MKCAHLSGESDISSRIDRYTEYIDGHVDMFQQSDISIDSISIIFDESIAS